VIVLGHLDTLERRAYLPADNKDFGTRRLEPRAVEGGVSPTSPASASTSRASALTWPSSRACLRRRRWRMPAPKRRLRRRAIRRQRPRRPRHLPRRAHCFRIRWCRSNARIAGTCATTIESDSCKAAPSVWQFEAGCSRPAGLDLTAVSVLLQSPPTTLLCGADTGAMPPAVQHRGGRLPAYGSSRQSRSNTVRQRGTCVFDTNFAGYGVVLRVGIPIS
jgi:hypothetical protein